MNRRPPGPYRLRARLGPAGPTLAAMILALGLVVGVATPPGLAAGPSIIGDGSSFAEVELAQWISDTGPHRLGLQVTYSPGDDAQGRSDFAGSRVDFAGTDIPYQPGESKPANSEYVNISAGGLAFMFNLVDTQGNKVTQLNLTPSQVCRIFVNPPAGGGQPTGNGPGLYPPPPWATAIYWDDPDLQANNPNVALPHQQIKVVVRGDPGAGTSFLFMQFCIAEAPQLWSAAMSWWKLEASQTYTTPPDFVDDRPHSDWPNCVCPERPQTSDEAANDVVQPLAGEGSITYLSYQFAVNRGLPVASIQNNLGVFTQPTADNVNQGLKYATTATSPPDSVGTLKLAFAVPAADAGDPQARNSYFPSTYTYIVVPTGGTDPGKGEVLARFLDYSVTDGQSEASVLGAAPLACGIVQSALADIARIPGAPPPPTFSCTATSAPPGQAGSGPPTTGANGPNPASVPTAGASNAGGPGAGIGPSTGSRTAVAPLRGPGSARAARGSTTLGSVPAGLQTPGEACAAGSTATVAAPGSLACGASSAFVIDVASPPYPQAIIDTAGVSGDEGDASPANNTATATTTVGTPAGQATDLSIATTPSVTVSAGSAMTDTIVATNHGPAPATGVFVTESLPPTVTVVAASRGCKRVAGTVACRAPNLAAGASVTVTVTVTTPAAAGMLTRSVAVHAHESEPIPGHNVATATTTVVAPGSADLSVTVGAPVTATTATAITQTIVTTNHGPATASGLVVTDALPAAVTFVSASPGCGGGPAIVSCRAPNLADEARVTVTVTVATPPSAGRLAWSATVHAHQVDPDPGDNVGAASTAVTAPGSADLSVVTGAPVTATTSSPVTYTVLATNYGPDAASGVVVSDTLPAGVIFVSASAGCTFAAGVVTCIPGESSSDVAGVVLSAGGPVPPAGGAGLRTLLEGAGGCLLVLGAVAAGRPARRRRVR